MNSKELSLKVVLIGDSGVGKSCLIQRFVDNKFTGKVLPTLSSSFFTKNLSIGGKQVSLHIWDTAGQEAYKSLAKMYFIDACIAILVYDITRLKSFESIQNYWLEELTNNTDENVVLGLAGNKCDLYNEEQVPEKDARELATKIKAIFSTTSCKDGIGIDELFEKCAKQYLENNKIKLEENTIKIDNKKDEKTEKKGCCKK